MSSDSSHKAKLKRHNATKYAQIPSMENDKMPQEYDARVNLHLDVNNGLERVTELVHTRLVESGWRDQVRLACRKAIVDNGDKHIPTVDELIALVTPKARTMVPDAVKRELLHEIELILLNLEKSGYAKSFEDV